MKLLTIAIVTNNYWPYNGGIVSSINSFARELLLKGHRVVIITFDFLARDSEQECVIPGLEIVRIPSLMRFKYKKNHAVIPWRYHKAVFATIKKIKPDIIHAQHPFLLGISALKAARNLGIPIVFTHHTQYECYAHYIPLPPHFTRPIIKQCVRSYCARVDQIIAPSQSIKNVIAMYGSVPCTVIPSGLLPEYHQPGPAIKLIDREFTLLCVSRFAREKSLELLIDMYVLLCELVQERMIEIIPVLKLIGYGADLSFLRSYAYEKCGLSEHEVSFIVRPAKNVIAHHYRQAHLFVFSSTTETQGIVLAESMAAATPVVALDGPGQRDIIQHGVNGFLVHSMRGMAQKIAFLMADQKSYAAMQRAAYETAQAYMPEYVTEHLLSVYRGLLLNK